MPRYTFATTTKLSHRLSARPIPGSSWPGTSRNRRGSRFACSYKLHGSAITSAQPLRPHSQSISTTEYAPNGPPISRFVGRFSFFTIRSSVSRFHVTANWTRDRLQTGSKEAAADAGEPGRSVCAFAGDRRHSVPAARGGSGYALSPPPTGCSFGHDPKGQRRVSVPVPGEGGEAERDHRSFV
jgi:hypothetical protein